MQPAPIPPQNWNDNIRGPNVQLNKKQLRQRIQSRNDFILLFGFERNINSPVLFAAEKTNKLAVHFQGSLRRKKAP